MDCGDSAFHPMGETAKMVEVVAVQGIERFLRLNFTDSGSIDAFYSLLHADHHLRTQAFNVFSQILLQRR